MSSYKKASKVIEKKGNLEYELRTGKKIGEWPGEPFGGSRKQLSLTKEHSWPQLCSDLLALAQGTHTT